MSVLPQGHYSCCCADTWASEVGILSKTPPRLITTGQKVPAGTNGGVTAVGLGCSAVASLFMGLCFAVLGAVTREVPPPEVLCPSRAARWSAGVVSDGGSWQPVWSAVQFWVPLSIVAGVFGSLVDSLLGATLQFSGVSTESKKAVSKPGPGVKHISGVDILSNDAVNAIAAAVTSAATAGLLLLAPRHLLCPNGGKVW